MREPGTNTYILPSTQIEEARLIEYDRLLQRCLGLFVEERDLTGVQTLLDLACGPGRWARAVAQQYHFSVTGIDLNQEWLEAARSESERNNISFQVVDIRQPLPVADGSFHLINGRFLSWLLFASDWTSILKECYRIVPEGGAIRLMEREWEESSSVALTHIGTLFKQALLRANRAFSQNGQPVSASSRLPHLLFEAGWRNIHSYSIYVPYTACKQAAQWKENLVVLLILLQPFLTQQSVISASEVSSLISRVKEDIKRETFLSTVQFSIIWGEKRAEKTSLLEGDQEAGNSVDGTTAREIHHSCTE